MTMPAIARIKAKLEAAVASAVANGFHSDEFGGGGGGDGGRQSGEVTSGRADPDLESEIDGPRLDGEPEPSVLTMITAIRPGGQRLVRGFFASVRQFPAIQKPLIDMKEIRAAYWTVVEELPVGQDESEKLRPAYLLFESTYDSDLPNYIHKFAEELPWHMRAIWGTGYGYPAVLPSSAFNRWVGDHRYSPDHSYLRYPEASTRMVASALRVAERLEAFDAAMEGCDDPDTFAFEFNRMVVELQGDI